MKVQDMFTIHFSGASGLPPTFIDEWDKGIIYGLKEGDFLEKYKIGCMDPMSKEDLIKY